MWTTTNALSGADTFGALTLVSQSSDAHTGSSALRVYTARFDTVGTPLGARALTSPGLCVSGDFVLNIPTNTLLLGGTISPDIIPGGGTPISGRLANIKGFYKYTPVFNDSTQSMDSCMVWATLKHWNGDSTEVVANAIFKSNVNTANAYVAFSQTFEYISCKMPDTLIILIY